MTNEDKAKIFVGYEIDTPRNLMRLEARDEYDNLLSMAKWKDQQFKEYLEEKLLQYAMPNGRYWYTPTDYTMRKWFTGCITEILQELFPND